MFIELTRCFSNCKILVNLSDISTILDEYVDYTTLILKDGDVLRVNERYDAIKRFLIAYKQVCTGVANL